MDVLNLTQINKLILSKQHLTEDSKIDDIIQITDDICGLHSTDLKTSYLSLFVRSHNFKRFDLERELYSNRNLGRIRGMRRTLFILTTKMIPIVFNATFNLIEKTFEKYMEYHKVSSTDYEKISRSIITLLKGKELSTSEIRKQIKSKANVPAIIHIMCSKCVLIRARPIKDWKDRRSKYALFSDYFPNIDLKEVKEKEAVQSLVEQYIKVYGPVSENDISWWTGLTKSTIRYALQNIETQFNKAKISSLKGTYIIHKSDTNRLQNLDNLYKPSLELLPMLDPYPMGYKDRDRYIDFDYYNNVFDRSGNITSTIVLDGAVIGVWDVEETLEPIIKFYLFHPIEDNEYDLLYSKAEKIGEFYFDKEIKIKEYDSMIPLTERTAGGFMTPLKIAKK